ncbi:MAG: IclR family transcriptional regulator [Actinomycetes bacterium]
MRAVTTAFRVLEEVALHQPVGVSELARLLDEPKSTVQRALQALHDVGWVEQEPGGTRRWVQTTKLLALASRGGGVGLRERAMPVLRELAEATDENIHLSVRNGRGITIVEKLDSSKSVRPHDPLGVVAPLHATSTGKAILAWSDHTDVEDVIAHGLAGFTTQTLVDPDTLRRELRSIRDTGYSVNRGEWRDDIRGVAAPIIDADGRARAAISVAVPAHRLPEEATAALGELVAASVTRLCTPPVHVERGA